MKPRYLCSIPEGWYEVHKGKCREGDKLVDCDTFELREVTVSAGSTIASMKWNRFRVIRKKS